LPRLSSQERSVLKWSQFGGPDFVDQDYITQAQLILDTSAADLYKQWYPQSDYQDAGYSPSKLYPLEVLATILLRAQACMCQVVYDELDSAFKKIPNKAHTKACFRTTAPIIEDWGELKRKHFKETNVSFSPDMLLFFESKALAEKKSERRPKGATADSLVNLKKGAF
jgi:hypothetical protein